MDAPKHFEPAKGKTLTESFLAACRAGQINRVKSYVAQGANIDAQDYGDYPNVRVTGNTGLMWAFNGGRDKLAKYLLEAGADPTIANFRGETPLHKCGAEFVRPLVAKGVDVNAQDADGKTPLNTVRYVWQEADRILRLIGQGADPKIPDNNGKTAIDLAEEQLQMSLRGPQTEAAQKTSVEYQKILNVLRAAPSRR